MLDKELQKELAENAVATPIKGEKNLYLVDFSKVRVGSIEVKAKTEKDALAKAEEWLKEDALESVISSWGVPTKAEKE